MTRSCACSIMQEAMLSCADATQPNYIASEDLGLLNFASTNTKTTSTFKITSKQLSMRQLPMAWLCEMANAVIGSNGELLENKHLIANPKTRATWSHSYGNKIGQLTQSIPGQNTGTNTVFFIKPKEQAKDVTYGLITTLIRPEKIDEPNRTRLVAGSNRVHFPGDAGTPTADLLTIKLLLNSIISTENARFMTMDMKDFYLNTRWLATNICASNSQTCPTTLSSITSSAN
jgi:hypothetical protein